MVAALDCDALDVAHKLDLVAKLAAAAMAALDPDVAHKELQPVGGDRSARRQSS